MLENAEQAAISFLVLSLIPLRLYRISPSAEEKLALFLGLRRWTDRAVDVHGGIEFVNRYFPHRLSSILKEQHFEHRV